MHVAQVADAVVALREPKNGFAHRSSDRQQRDSDARRAVLRITSFKPDHTWSIAQTLTSTSPLLGSTMSRMTSSVISVSILLDRLGQATQIMPFGAIAEVRRGRRAARS